MDDEDQDIPDETPGIAKGPRKKKKKKGTGGRGVRKPPIPEMLPPPGPDIELTPLVQKPDGGTP